MLPSIWKGALLLLDNPRRIWTVAFLLLLIQAAQIITIVHRESLTFDEDDHMFAGYMMWKKHDYGLNPEHPPFVKLLATVPVVGKALWTPPLQGRFFKIEAYLDGRDWLIRNDGGSQWLIFRMRLATVPLALGLSLLIFLAAWEWFGSAAALLALTIAVFEPTMLAHSGLVTTDMGLTCFLLASIYAFYRYCRKPSIARLVLTGLAAGLLISSKHSGILLAPMLLLLAAYEVFSAQDGKRSQLALRLLGSLTIVAAIAVLILWCFYGFRYAARPAGLALSTSLVDYSAPLHSFSRNVVLFCAHHHLLPESYLMGLVDVKLMAQGYPTYIFGKVYPHGFWWYFPVLLLIKTTLGMIALAVLTIYALLSGKATRHREFVYAILPPFLYLAIAMLSGMNIGARHVLPLFAFAALAISGGVIALINSKRRWLWTRVCALLIVFHIASSLAVFPVPLASRNEACRGPRNPHNL